METLTKTASKHRRLGKVTVAAGFPWGEQPEFPMGEMKQCICKIKIKKDY